MKTIELKHLAAYLPYKLRLYVSIHFRPSTDIFYLQSIDISDNEIRYMCQEEGSDLIDVYNECTELSNVKPVLRPLSDLTKEIEVSGAKTIMIYELGELIDEHNLGYDDFYINYEKFSESGLINWLLQPYFIVERLLELHFDIFGLIDVDLAIDINSLKP
jgi:hypothetical protein